LPRGEPLSFSIGTVENRCVAYAPDGSALAVGRRDGSIVLVSAAGRGQAVLPGLPVGITAVAYAPGAPPAGRIRPGQHQAG
jgi:hypothetical protein